MPVKKPKATWLKPIKGLIRYAISEGDLAHDPSKEIELIKPAKTMGHMTWKLPQVQQYREQHTLGTVARLVPSKMGKLTVVPT